jgi:hypothetical protein
VTKQNSGLRRGTGKGACRLHPVDPLPETRIHEGREPPQPSTSPKPLLKSRLSAALSTPDTMALAASQFESARHVLMLNIPYGRAKNKDGARDFQKMTIARLQQYATRVHAQLQVVRSMAEVPTTPPVVDAWTRTPPGRGNSTIYVIKLLAVGQAAKMSLALGVTNTVSSTSSTRSCRASACPTASSLIT